MVQILSISIKVLDERWADVKCYMTTKINDGVRYQKPK